MIFDIVKNEEENKDVLHTHMFMNQWINCIHQR